MKLTLKVVNAVGDILAKAGAEDEALLVYRAEYCEGDRLVVEVSQPGHIWLALDAGMPPTLVFLHGNQFILPVPSAAKRKSYPPQAFSGNLHRIAARRTLAGEIGVRRNLALNPFDDHENTSLFPHVYASTETRGEAAFAARNVIDGEKASAGHGFWPYTSWGINRDPEASLTLVFGRAVLIDQLTFYLRADFPHDAWWEKASVTFSDGESASFFLQKTGAAQSFPVAPRQVEWIRLHDLKKADDPSPFPALTQIEVWGADLREAP
ncbi:carbohydrate-binding protein [Agrobacterium tumefaciens]|uniref:carbohydrate-binding protein n=1 Tax=Agrobacterium TaxID=357 RepID=UPI00115D05B5|nr:MULTISPECIES: carbohydrate-binding protein [Agrobacterium]MDA5241926.1 carbohydrate-binding protein [Agrobacterium sp. MAFF310724]MDA5248549.1 carbohydrate-binding protein [Agrobacterium sp. MAFF210268]TRB15072.1 carbohydrate-binding protein [Agrobacterium tumefaciens]